MTMSLPHGLSYASLFSCCQVQRLNIARALERPSKALILYKCTSAVDPANQTAVMETIDMSSSVRLY